MKKALSYAAIAILLGIVTMFAPLLLIKPAVLPAYGDKKAAPVLEDRNLLPLPAFIEGNETLDRTEALGRTLHPSNLSFAALMLIPSLFLALGVSLCFKKRTF
ncbi:MAG: hypothetical protein ACUVRA_08510 [Candidatus Bathyarchaeaceae archaeon]